jgi:hypothetical protein
MPIRHKSAKTRVFIMEGFPKLAPPRGPSRTGFMRHPQSEKELLAPEGKRLAAECGASGEVRRFVAHL